MAMATTCANRFECEASECQAALRRSVSTFGELITLSLYAAWMRSAPMRRSRQPILITALPNAPRAIFMGFARALEGEASDRCQLADRTGPDEHVQTGTSMACKTSCHVVAHRCALPQSRPLDDP